MNYIEQNTDYAVKPIEFSKNSSKEILQYAVGGLLYMPANNTKIAAKIISREYAFVKSMVLDLEDSLGDELVGFGMTCIRDTLSTLADAVSSEQLRFEDIPLIFIRVRDFGQMHDIFEQLGELINLVTGFNIPKFDKYNCDKYIDEFNAVNTKCSSKLYMMPIIENKSALYQQYRMDNLVYIYDSLKGIADNVLNMRVGGTDFCNIIGVRRGIKDTIYDIGAISSVLSDIINVFGRSYVVSGPVWEFFENKNDKSDKAWEVGLRREIYRDHLNGFIGKTCIHPSQLPIVQQSLKVSAHDYNDAVNILGMNKSTIGVKGSVQGNRMNEAKTHGAWAEKIIGLASVYGGV